MWKLFSQQNIILKFIIMDIRDYFEELWLNNSDREIFLNLYSLGSQPASIISKSTWYERTLTYKIIMKLYKMWLVSKTQKSWISYFFVPSLDVIKNLLDIKKKNLDKLDNNFDIIKTSIESKYSRNDVIIPKISIYNWMDGISFVYKDILNEIEKQGLLTIKFFGSNIFEEQKSHIRLRNYAQDFFEKIKLKSLKIDTYIANWWLIMEKINNSFLLWDFLSLPAWEWAINIFIAWTVVYILIYNNIPIAIKMDSDKVSQAFHLIFDEMKK